MSTYGNEIQLIADWRQHGQRVVLVTGVFDVLHIEHIRFLSSAKRAGDKLVVGVETDSRVRQIKGAGRPINSQAIRLEQLAALKPIDYAFLLPTQFSTQADWEGLMATLRPDVYAVSSHSGYLENKKQICQKYGCKLQIVLEHNPDISTTQIIQAALADKPGF